MNVLLLYKNSGQGGLTTNTRDLYQGLKAQGICVVAAGSEGIGSDTILKEVEKHTVEFKSKNFIRIYRQIAALVREYDIDIIHAQNRVPALYAAVYCWFHRKVKYLWVNHLVPIPAGWRHRIMTRYGYCAVADSVAGEEFLVKALRIPENNVRRILLGVDLTRFSPVPKEDQVRLKAELGLSGEKVIFLYGRLHPAKGHLFLLDALAQIKTKVPYKLVFPGVDDDFRKELQVYGREHAMEDQMVFPGFVDGRSYLSISDLVVLPSKQESFSIACVEAYAMGVPVIRTRTGGYEDAKDFCFGVDYGNTRELADLLQLFFDGDSMFQERATYAREHVERFSLERMIREYVELYEEMLRKQ